MRDTPPCPKQPSQELPWIRHYHLILPVVYEEAGQVRPQPLPPQYLQKYPFSQQIIRFLHVQEKLKQRLVRNPDPLLIQLGLEGFRTHTTPLPKPMD